MTTAWYEAPSHAAGAALAAAVTGDVDVRASGVRVWADDPEVAAAARELGLTAGTLQTLDVVIEAADPVAVRAFWERVLGEGRHPVFSVRQLDEPRPLRNRIHVDVVRPEEQVIAARAGREPSGPFGVMLADSEGNEVDLVPGERLPGTRDWYALFSAMVCYPDAPAQFVIAAAELADRAGIPLQFDVRAAGVTIAGAKDAWEGDDGADPAFVALAQQIEGAAKGLGLRADPAPLRFVQFGIDALDVPAVRAFWIGLLGYEPDPRPQLTDIYDPRGLNPVLFFQQLKQPRPQRNRIHFELTGENVGLISDPEGNEVLVRT
ncbi:VOC family protein [Kribbella sp. NPDC004536]|uniref:VOC family protein n=1 Tax=Kribbella sp. NPDC004536 TaxID=3364106 RepID=UPI0036C7ECA7